MAYFYTYTDPAKIEAQFAQQDDSEKRKKSLEMGKRDSLEHRNEKRRYSDSSSDEDDAKQTKM